MKITYYLISFECEPCLADITTRVIEPSAIKRGIRQRIDGYRGRLPQCANIASLARRGVKKCWRHRRQAAASARQKAVPGPFV